MIPRVRCKSVSAPSRPHYVSKIRREIEALNQLLQLNHGRYEEKVWRGLYEKKASTKTGQSVSENDEQDKLI